MVSLWRACGLVVPWNDPAKNIRRKLRVQREMFLVGWRGSRLVATVMAGYEWHRGWINYLTVAPDYRRHGLGRRLMEEAEALLRGLGCAKFNMQVRSSNAAVVESYQRLGFSVDDVVSMGKRLEAD